MRTLLVTLLTTALLVFTACCCGDMETDDIDIGAEATPEPAPSYPAADRIKSATICRALGDHQQAVDPATEFQATDIVYFSMEIKGRPSKGIATGKFLFQDGIIAEASVDLSDTNSGVLFSFGEDTFAGYNLTPTDPLPVSPRYRVEAYLDGEQVGEWPFEVVRPPGSPAPKVREAALAHGCTDSYAPIRPATTFAAGDTVHIVGFTDLCQYCWLQVEWFVAGTVNEEGTRSFTGTDNNENVGFTFSFIPEGGWPAGTHEAVLTMNDLEMGRHSFTVE